MRTVNIPHMRCRICFCSITEDLGRPIQVTDANGKALPHNQSAVKIKSLLHLMLDFPENFNCALEFPHFICELCDRQINDFSLFIERAQLIDSELRLGEKLSKRKTLDEIDAAVRLNCLFQKKSLNQNDVLICSTNEEINESVSRESRPSQSVDTFHQYSKTIRLKQQKPDQHARNRPISILPKGTHRHSTSSYEESVDSKNPFTLNKLESSVSTIRSHSGKASNWSETKSCEQCGIVIQASEIQKSLHHVCETKNKGCVSCQFPECKRRFDTTTALRHHLKHFHAPRIKKCSKIRYPRSLTEQANKQSAIDAKFLSFENSNMMTENTTINPTNLNYAPGLVSNSILPPSSGTERLPFVPMVDSKPTRRINSNNEVVLNLKKPFICSHTGCLKAYQNKHYLIQHERVHKGEKPYLCKSCDRRFYRITDLKKHILLKVCQ